MVKMAFLNMHTEAYYLLQTQRENIQIVKVRGPTLISKWSFTVTGRRRESSILIHKRQTNILVWVYLYCRSISAGTLSLKVLQNALFITVTCHTALPVHPRLPCISKVVCDNGAYSCNALVSNVKTHKCQITFYVICRSIMNMTFSP